MNFPTPMVSVVMSVFNGASFLRECVESVLAQDFTDFEFLIVDDGSRDNSLEILQSFQDPRIRIFPVQENRGLPSCLNLGIREARGTFIARMDADDLCLPSRLRAQVDFLRAHPEVGVLGTAVRLLKANKQGERIQFPSQNASIKSMLPFGCPFFHPSVMLRRKALMDHGLFYDESYRRSQDYELWSRAAEHLKFANLPSPLLLFRRHQDSVSSADRPTQTRFADEVRTRCVRRLLPEVSQEDMQLHNRLLALGSGPHQSLAPAVETWLRLLLGENRTRKVYPVREFSQAVGMRWYTFCTKLTPQGWSSYRRFWSSSLAREARLSPRQHIGQILRSLGFYSKRSDF
jgi:glycosyltransferase involved in cell wall biosynthesis